MATINNSEFHSEIYLGLFQGAFDVILVLMHLAHMAPPILEGYHNFIKTPNW